MGMSRSQYKKGWETGAVTDKVAAKFPLPAIKEDKSPFNTTINRFTG